MEENKNLEQTYPKKLREYPCGTVWIFDDKTKDPVPEYLLPGIFKDGQKYFLYENGKRKKIATRKQMTDRRSNAVMRFIHNGKKVPLYLIKENQDFVETPHGNISIIKTNDYHRLKCLGKLPQPPAALPKVQPAETAEIDGRVFENDPQLAPHFVQPENKSDDEQGSDFVDSFLSKDSSVFAKSGSTLFSQSQPATVASLSPRKIFVHNTR